MWAVAALAVVSGALLSGEPVAPAPLDPALLMCAAIPGADDAAPAPRHVVIVNSETGEVVAKATC